jgi:hypothetical protein
MTLAGLLLLAVFLIAAALVLTIGMRTWLRYRGQRVIECPENHAPAGVEVDARQAAVSALGGRLELHLKDCTRWPERAGCDEACLRQVETSPEGCLVRTVLARWYEGRTCALCGAAFGEIHWHDHKPALLTPDGVPRSWAELPVDHVPEVLQTHRPLCWNCQVTESFRRRFPELVIDRDEPDSRDSGVSR